MRSRTWVASALSGALAVATVVASVGVGTAAASGTAAKTASHSRTALAPCLGADLKVTLGRSRGPRYVVPADPCGEHRIPGVHGQRLSPGLLPERGRATGRAAVAAPELHRRPHPCHHD